MAKRPGPGLPRNTSAMDAKTRHAGPMRHRTEPRGGATNESRDLLAEAQEEQDLRVKRAEALIQLAEGYGAGNITASELECRVLLLYGAVLPGDVFFGGC